MNWTAVSFFGIRKVGAAHSLWLTFFKTPALANKECILVQFEVLPHVFFGPEMVYYDKGCIGF
jgi:hypothetical protein